MNHPDKCSFSFAAGFSSYYYFLFKNHTFTGNTALEWAVKAPDAFLFLR